MSTAESKKKDPTWKYTQLKDPKDTNSHICPFCNKQTNGGIARQKEHLVGTMRKKKNTKLCKNVPNEVKEEILAYVEQQRAMKAQQQYDFVPDFDEEDNMVEVEEEEVQGPSQRRKGKAPAIQRGNSLPSSRGSAPGLSAPRKRGPMDAFFTPDPEIEVQK